MGYIYKITDKTNQKIYIGQTIKERATDRFSQHRYLANHPEQEKKHQLFTQSYECSWNR